MAFRTNGGRGSSGHGVALFSGALAAESANATNLQVTTQPVGSTSPNLATQPVVTAKKSLGSTDTSYVGTVVPTLNVLTGSATLGGSEATGKACVAGVCTFTNLTVTAASGATWTITFTSGSLAPAVSNTGTTTATNSAPNQPTLSAGSLTSSGATLTGSAFSDSDVGDTHAASQWQVTTAADTGYASPVISTGDDATHKTSYAATGLSASTAYIARVRYKDSAGNYSAWSTSASFTTAAAASGIALVAHTASAGQNTFTTTGIDTTGATLVVAAVSHSVGVAPTFTDSKGNTWTALTEKYSGDVVSERLYYCQNPTVGAGHTITLTGSNIFASVQFAAFSGTLTASVFQVEAGAFSNASVTTLQPGSVTPAADGYLVVTGLGFESGLSAGTQAINASFTILDTSAYSGTNYGSSLAYLIQGTAAAVNPAWSWTGGSFASAVIAVFKTA